MKKDTGIVLFMLICSSQLFLHIHNTLYYRAYHLLLKYHQQNSISNPHFGGTFPNNDHKVSQSGQVTCIHYKNTKLISNSHQTFKRTLTFYNKQLLHRHDNDPDLGDECNLAGTIW